jgi:hypothetical protein
MLMSWEAVTWINPLQISVELLPFATIAYVYLLTFLSSSLAILFTGMLIVITTW